MKRCTLKIYDEVNVQFCGVSSEDIKRVISETELFVKGANQTAAYKIGAWNGRSSLVDSDGNTLFFMIDDVGDILGRLKYQVEIEDYRKQDVFQPDMVDCALFEDYGVILRPNQVDSINAVICREQGIIDSATSSGKSWICAGVAKVYDEKHRTIVIVPSEILVKQTAADFVRFGLDVGVIHGKSNKKKEWEHRHIIATWQSLNRNRAHLGKFGVVLVDEVHVCGDVLYSLLREDLRKVRIRIGLTGTLPTKDKQKRQKICAHIGDGPISVAKPRELIDQGHISDLYITMHPVFHHDPELLHVPEYGEYEWDIELGYMSRDMDRVRAIADFIETIPRKNTMILVHREFGENLSNHMQLGFIDQSVDTKKREELIANFVDQDEYRLIATYGTVGTGISIDDIYQIVLVDAGKNETNIIQGIGRGLRKDSKGVNFCKIFDIYSEILFSTKHASERRSIYRRYQYPFEVSDKIIVN